MVAIVLVILIHLAIGYVLITGLAYEAFEKARDVVTTVDVTEEPEPEPEPEELPPPPEEPVPVTAPPPPMAPPPPVNISRTPPQIQTTVNIPPPAPPARIIPPAAPPGPPPPPPAPPPPPPPAPPPVAATPRGNPASWASQDDYPARALRNEEQGTTGFRLQVNAQGRVSDCQVTRSSGSSELDEATCRLITRRARFNPAQQNGRPVAGTYSNAITWVIPE